MPFDVKTNLFRSISCGVAAFVTQPTPGTQTFKVVIGTTPDVARHAWFQRPDLKDLINELVRVYNDEIPGEDRLEVCRVKDQLTINLL